MRSCVAVLSAAVLAAGCGGGGDPVGIEEAKRCLVEHEDEFRVMGPLDGERGDEDAPDRTLMVGGAQASAYLAYYDDAKRAESLTRELEEAAKAYDGRVDRHGRLTIIWTNGADSSQASKIEACALES